MRRSALALIILFAASACRGREYLAALPNAGGEVPSGVVALVAAAEAPHRASRAVLIHPASGAATELELIQNAQLKEIYQDTKLIVDQYALSRLGKIAQLAPHAHGKNKSYFACSLSPQRYFVACQISTGISVVDVTTGAEQVHKGSYRSCSWGAAKRLICLEGSYQKENRIVAIDPHEKPITTIAQNDKDRITGLTADAGTGRIAYATGKDQSWIFWRKQSLTAAPERLGEISGHYIFDARISPLGVVAARVAAAENREGILRPRNIWVSPEFGGRKGQLLDLAELPAPGFFSGSGFGGVESFDFSPDGMSLAILMSGENDCRMVDEGGNIACRLNVHIFDSRAGELKQLTHFRATELRSVLWRSSLKAND
ncbi:hypothetical protein [Turneriella parva]|uniref:Lipoprotein n=1 Tax=Turneriella parva (strain ATCC BAA-1111 / DSM 21527 / NCTC 11395 / H) TaxID=869212 RepID=I4B233_TURPD|nr:hypothetical protein [Turneriella parva]AFM11340.1 hypothetical protein Turpa_0689 [Turneriella parva DSM 21527]